VVDRLTQAGLVVKRVKAMPDFARIQRQHLMLMAAEAARFHAAWFREFGALYHAKTVDLIRDGRSIIDADIYQAQAGKARLRQQLRELMDAHAIDLWLTPSATGPAPLGLDSTGDPIMNLPWTYAGVPTLTLRSGSAENGLPLAVQLSARWHADEALFQWGQHIAPLLHSEE
jgi:Asp-tRNA(Asn)/Glu-tRNA(Gln) amidotransferase A subunit family amidase